MASPFFYLLSFRLFIVGQSLPGKGCRANTVGRLPGGGILQLLAFVLAFAAAGFGQASSISNSQFKIPNSLVNLAAGEAPMLGAPTRATTATTATAAAGQPFLPVIVQAVPSNHARRTFWIMAGTEAALTGLDIWTSQRNQAHGAIESWSAWEMGRTPGAARMSLTLLGEAAARNLAAHWLDSRGHHRWARAVQFAGSGVEASAVVNNFVWAANHSSAPEASAPVSVGTFIPSRSRH